MLRFSRYLGWAFFACGLTRSWLLFFDRTCFQRRATQVIRVAALILQFDVPPVRFGHRRSPSIVRKGCLL